MSERVVFGSSTCGKCGEPLAFYRLPNGKACPCNPDGTDHWDLCRKIRYAKAKRGVLRRIEFSDGSYREQWEVPGEKPFVVKMSSGPPKPKTPVKQNSAGPSK